MRKIVLAAVAVTGVLTLSACKQEEAPVVVETSTEVTEAAPVDTATVTVTETAVATEAASEAPKM